MTNPLRSSIMLRDPIDSAVGVAVSDLAQPRRVYQHADGQTYKDVTFTGAYISVSGNLQVRARKVSDGTTAVDWTTATPGAGNTFSVVLRLQMAYQWVWLDTRDSAVPGAVISTMLTKVGVGVRAVLAGQSNRSRRQHQVAPIPVASDLAMRHSGGSIRGHYLMDLSKRTDEASSNNGADGFGGNPDLLLQNTFCASAGVILELMPWAVSGSAFTTWVTAANGGSGTNWTSMLNGLGRYNNDTEFRYWLHFQGEAAASSGDSEATVLAQLGFIESQAYALCGSRADFRFFYSRIASSGGTTAATDVVGIAIQKYINANTSTRVRRAGAMVDIVRDVDDLHYPYYAAADGYVRASLRDAQSLLNDYNSGVTPYDGGGPVLTGASGVAGNNYIDLTTALSGGGTRLQDRSGSAVATGLPNFYVVKGGVAQGFGPTAITGNTTLRVTLPSGTLGAGESWTVQHVYGKSDTSNFVYDNNTVPGDTLGKPLEPSVPLAVSGL